MYWRVILWSYVFFKGRKKHKGNKKPINNYNVLNVDEETSIAYGNIKAALRKKGKPIPENDIWIAAIALKNNLVVVTRDKHFEEIESITIKKW